MSLIGMLVCGSWMLQSKSRPLLAEPHQHEYVRLSLDDTLEDQNDIVVLITRMRELTAACRANPDHARSQLRLARGYMQVFEHAQKQSENAMSLAQIRDAAYTGGFTTDEELLAWLDVVLEDRRQYLDKALYHARRALELCPMQAPAYIYVAQLTFLETLERSDEAASIDQALALRPHEPEILFEAGRFRIANGQPLEGLEFWRQAARERGYEQAIYSILVPFETAPNMIKHFEPDYIGLQMLMNGYASVGRDAVQLGEGFQEMDRAVLILGRNVVMTVDDYLLLR